MSRIVTCAFSGLFAASLLFTPIAFAETPAAAPANDCAAKAVSKTGKPLAGAAKASFMKKCEADAKGAAVADTGCAGKAISKAGKPLAGAAKASFIKKCESDAKAGK